MGGLSKHQKKILEILEIRPEMTTKEIAETIYGKIIQYKTKEYHTIRRSLISLEKQGLIQRVHVQLRWKVSIPKKDHTQQTAT